jgi:methylenetetrahydrofolate dehydrogenase (NADP+)/methenyltetrahydrofolate cyclohydrolase
MKYLNGSEIAGFIKERQARQIRSLVQSKGVKPRLDIVICGNDAASKKYTQIKQNYGENIGVEVVVHNCQQSEVASLINELNNSELVTGIIVQLPLPDPAKTSEIVSLIKPEKDVDSLRDNNHFFDSATATAILWLLAGYNIELNAKNIVIVGRGKLVGSPLEKIMLNSGLKPTVIDEFTANNDSSIAEADILITAVGKPGIIKAEQIKPGAVVVDAGVASEDGLLKGDVAEAVYDREDIKAITPRIGGVGPLTVAALFDNLIKAASN